MSDPNKPTTENTIKATRAVLGLLPQIAGLVVGLLAIAYVMGWRQASAYYAELGAPWVMSLLTPIQIMQVSVWHISLIAIFLFISIHGITKGEFGQKGLKVASVVCMGVAATLYLGTLFSNHIVDQFLAIGMGMFWSIAAGLTLGELVASLALSELQWSSYHVYLLYFVMFWGLLYASDVAGKISAKIIADGGPHSLPAVLVKDSQGNREWHLVSPVGERFLLTSVQGTIKTRKFKLVSPSEIQEIESTQSSGAATPTH